jgi:hypothetical protein
MPVSTNERERSAPAAVDTPVRPGNCEEARTHQAALLDVWEDEGGGPRYTFARKVRRFNTKTCACISPRSPI